MGLMEGSLLAVLTVLAALAIAAYVTRDNRRHKGE